MAQPPLVLSLRLANIQLHCGIPPRVAKCFLKVLDEKIMELKKNRMRAYGRHTCK